jgi:hypothetical protein
MIKQVMTTDDSEREALLRQYLLVAGATLGEGTPPEALVPTMIELITQDLAHLLQPLDSDTYSRPTDGAPVEIPVLDTKNGQTILFTFGGS